MSSRPKSSMCSHTGHHSDPPALVLKLPNSGDSLSDFSLCKMVMSIKMKVLEAACEETP